MNLRSDSQRQPEPTDIVWRLYLPWLLPLILPIFALLAYLGEGELLLLTLAAGTPLLFMLFLLKEVGARRRDSYRHKAQSTFDADMARILNTAERDGIVTVCFMLQLDAFHEVADRFGGDVADSALAEMTRRLTAAIRENDAMARMGHARFAIILGETRKIDLEIAIQMARRFQTVIEEPVQVGGVNIYLSCCVGFCLSSRLEQVSPSTLLEASAVALTEAMRHAPAAIRSYTPEMGDRAATRQQLLDEAVGALARGQIRAWFQPQISTDTGEISGFEALARWEHPTRGVIPPAEFLEALEHAGQTEHLNDIMLDQALAAIRAWRDCGFDVPQVGVNFAKHELRNPKLVDKVAWKLDQLDVAPRQLVVEVLETVVSGSPEDVIARNINGLADLGCRIDLDDFGTGHASISSIRRFAVSRLKIDRSFVIRADRDPEQQRMIHTIIAMAERLGLETLAEGVESTGEHSILAQLGCGHVQGFGIAHPMRFDETIAWMRQHARKLASAPEIGRKTG